MLEIMKGDQVVAQIKPGGRFHIPEQKLVIFNVTLDTEIPGHTVRQYVQPEPSEPSEPSNNPNAG